MSSRKLPVKLIDNFQVSFFYYFPLSCINAYTEYQDWYYMNYIDIIGVSRKLNRRDQQFMNYDIRYPDGESYFSRRVSSNSMIMFDEYDLDLICIKEGIISFIKKNIDMDKYIILYINMSRLESIDDQNLSIHDIFVYGYDDIAKTISIGSMINRKYTLFEVSYKSIEKGFEDYISYVSDVKGKKKILITFYLTNSIAALDPNDMHCFVKPEYRVDSLLNKINSYINGKISCGDMIISDKQNINSLYSGIESYHLFCEYLYELMYGQVQTTGNSHGGFDSYDFMLPFYYVNHKKGLLERLDYAYVKTGKSMYKKIAEEYKIVETKMNIINNKHMKLHIMDTNITNKIYDEFNFMIEDVKKEEKDILCKLF